MKNGVWSFFLFSSLVKSLINLEFFLCSHKLIVGYLHFWYFSNRCNVKFVRISRWKLPSVLAPLNQTTTRSHKRTDEFTDGAIVAVDKDGTSSIYGWRMTAITCARRNVKMADLNKELNEYLLNNKNEKQYKIAIPSVALPKANFRKWFGKDAEETREDAGWIQRSQRECCPAMVVHPFLP